MIFALAFLPLLAMASDVSLWPKSTLNAQIERTMGEPGQVLEARGYTLKSAGAVHGVVLGRYQIGNFSYARVMPVFEQNGQELVGGGTSLGGSHRTRLLGVMDLDVNAALIVDFTWTSSTIQEPSGTAKKPILVVLTERQDDDGGSQVDALLFDIREPEKMMLIGRVRVAEQYPVRNPDLQRPAQRILATEGLSMAIKHGEKGTVLELVEQDVSTPDNRCKNPGPRTRRFVLEERRFVEKHDMMSDSGCQ